MWQKIFSATCRTKVKFLSKIRIFANCDASILEGNALV